MNKKIKDFILIFERMSQSDFVRHSIKFFHGFCIQVRVQAIMFRSVKPPIGVNNGRNQEEAIIQSALEELKKITLEHNDVIYMRAIGAKPAFNSGMEAYEFIKQNNIDIRFAKLAFDDAHASWNHREKAVLINERYRNSNSFPEILALSEAIFHEAGHAKDNDGENSIQEELDCLALNVLGHRYNKSTHKDVFLGQNSFLFSEGVSLYEKLFYKFDPAKQELKARVVQKYGFLQQESPGHPASNFVKEVKNIAQKNVN